MKEPLVTLETYKLAKKVGFPGFDSIRKFSAPTQSLLQQWLREVHNIDVYCIPWLYEGEKVYDFYINYKGESRAYPSYERALEDGLQEALKTIKDK